MPLTNVTMPQAEAHTMPGASPKGGLHYHHSTAFTSFPSSAHLESAPCWATQGTKRGEKNTGKTDLALKHQRPHHQTHAKPL